MDQNQSGFVNPSMSTSNGQSKSFEEKLNEIGVGVDDNKTILSDIKKGQNDLLNEFKKLQDSILKIGGSTELETPTIDEMPKMEENIETEVPSVAENEPVAEIPSIPEIGNVDIPNIDISVPEQNNEEIVTPEVGEVTEEVPQIEAPLQDAPLNNEVETNEIDNNTQEQNDGFLAIGDLLNSVDNSETPVIDSEVPTIEPSVEGVQSVPETPVAPAIEIPAPMPTPEAPAMETPVAPAVEMPAPMPAPEVPAIETPVAPTVEMPAPMPTPEAPTMETPVAPAVEMPAPMPTPEVPTMETPVAPAVEMPAPMPTPEVPTMETPVAAPATQDNVEKIVINITDAQTTNGKQRSTVVSESAQNNLLGKANTNTLSLAA